MTMRLAALILMGFFGLACYAQERVATARINLTSEPTGATVTVDGVVRGRTPLMLFDLLPGRHLFHVTQSGYVAADDFVTLIEGRATEKNFVLAEEKGLLLLKTEPAGCNIKVDGVSVGESPRFIGNLSARDTHLIRLSKTGYQDQTISVKFNGREPLVREEKLILNSAVVNLITDPAGAEVWVNGVSRGTTPTTVRGVPKGTASVKFKLDGYAEEMRELRLNAGDEPTLSVTLMGLPGTLYLLSNPAGASFYLNEEARGVGPVTIPNLKPGEYVVRCEKEGFAPLTRTIRIRNGAAAREEFKLESVMGRIEVKTSPAGADVYLDGHKLGVSKSSGGEISDYSDVFPIENVLEGEHTLVVRKDGFQEVSRTIRVVSKKTAKHHHITLRRAFIPNIEVTTANGVFQGVFVSQTDATIVIETSPGTEYPIPRQFIRSVKYLTP